MRRAEGNGVSWNNNQCLSWITARNFSRERDNGAGKNCHAEQGRGAFCNGKKIQVLDEDNINKILIGLDGGKETETFKRASLARYEERLYSSNGVTCTLSSGCASVPLALVASGKMHAYLALSLEPWDMAAGVIINREAGTKVTNVRNKEWTLDDPSILVANPLLHSNIYDFIKDLN